MWIGVDDLLSMSSADLTQWSQEGIGGFAANVGLLTGMGGTQKFTADPNADLSSSPYVIEDQFEELQYCGGGSRPGDEALPGPRPHELLQHRYAIGGLVRRFGLVQHRSSRCRRTRRCGPPVGLRRYRHGRRVVSGSGKRQDRHLGVELPWAIPTRRSKPEKRSCCGGSNSWPRFCKPSRTCRSPTTPPGSPTPGTPMSSIRARMSRTPMTRTSTSISWDGMTSVDGYAGIWFYDETFNKDTGLTSGNAQTWNSALTYEYNSLFSLFSQDFTNWSYAADHVFLSPSAWIDGDVANEGQWAAPRSPAYVATQLQAFRNLGNGRRVHRLRICLAERLRLQPLRQCPAGRCDARAVDGTPPALSIVNETTTGNTVSLSGTSSDSYAIRDVRYTSSSGASGRGHGELADRRWELLDRLCQPHELECAQYRAASRGEHDHHHR